MDSHLENGENDLFGRMIFASRLAEKIQSESKLINTGALAIGITGSWGSGKTSFLKQIECQIDQKNRIIIHFNPWRSTSPRKIIEDFFELLIDELAPYSPDLKTNISKYAKTLTKIDDNTFTKVLEEVSSFLAEDENKNKIYSKINTSIEKLKKQVIIFIDDLDRLDKKEIVEVLRIIRNTGSFNKVVYIAAYDTGYITEAIKMINEFNYSTFLEKIFQFEFSLPKYDKQVLRNNIKAGLKDIIISDDYQLVCEGIDELGYRDEYITDMFISTQRDVVRFLNAFSFEIETIKPEVQIIDFYYLQLLNLKYPLLHEYLYRYKKYFFIVENDELRLRKQSEREFNKTLFDFDRLSKYNTKVDEHPEEDVPLLNSFLLKDSSFKLLGENEKSSILNLIILLLAKKNHNPLTSQVLAKSFIYERNFEKYFTYSILSSDISSAEFDKVRKGTWDGYKDALLTWLNQGRLPQVEFYLDKIKDFGSRNEFINHLNALIEICKLYFTENKSSIAIGFQGIFEVLKYPIKTKQQVLLFNDRTEYHDFVNSFFVNATFPYVFESNILAAAVATENEFALNIAEIESLSIDYLTKYTEQVHKVTDELYRLRGNCLTKSRFLNREPEISDQANTIFISHFKKYLTACQLGKFIRQTNPGSEYYELQKSEWSFFFETFDQFVDWINNSNNLTDVNACKLEMLEFIKQIKVNSLGPIKFEFKNLTPIRYQSTTLSALMES